MVAYAIGVFDDLAAPPLTFLLRVIAVAQHCYSGGIIFFYI